MSPEVRIRTLAAANSAMQSHFGSSPFRWFDTRLAQRFIALGPCVRYRRISTIRMYEQAGLNPLSQPLIQFDVCSTDSELARTAARDLIEFLGTVDLSTDSQFACPATTPQHFPSFVVGQRSGKEPEPEPAVFIQSVDVRFFALEN